MNIVDKMWDLFSKIEAGEKLPPFERCARCGKTLQTFKLDDEKAYCDDCEIERRKEELALASPPCYDIETILNDGDAMCIVDKLSSHLHHDSRRRSIPWSVLLPAEVMCRAFVEFDTLMGNGFDTLMTYGEGPEIFIRAHNALIDLKSVETLQITSEAKEVFVNHGIEFPDPVPQDWWLDAGIAYEFMEKLFPEIYPLSKRYWNHKEDVHGLLLQRLKADVKELRNRKSA